MNTQNHPQTTEPEFRELYRFAKELLVIQDKSYQSIEDSLRKKGADKDTINRILLGIKEDASNSAKKKKKLNLILGPVAIVLGFFVIVATVGFFQRSPIGLFLATVIVGFGIRSLIAGFKK